MSPEQLKEYDIKSISMISEQGVDSSIIIKFNNGRILRTKAALHKAISDEYLINIIHNDIAIKTRKKKINKLIRKNRLINKIINKVKFNLKNN